VDSHGNKIVNRLQAVHRLEMDSVSIIFYQIAGLMVKISNLVSKFYFKSVICFYPNFICLFLW
jgi:hypothetical protein